MACVGPAPVLKNQPRDVSGNLHSNGKQRPMALPLLGSPQHELSAPQIVKALVPPTFRGQDGEHEHLRATLPLGRPVGAEMTSHHCRWKRRSNWGNDHHLRQCLAALLLNEH